MSPRELSLDREDGIAGFVVDIVAVKPRKEALSDWEVNGSFMEWDYTIDSPSHGCIATITKELFRWTDTYVIDVADPKDALGALMVVLAIDAEKCSRNK